MESYKKEKKTLSLFEIDVNDSSYITFGALADKISGYRNADYDEHVEKNGEVIQRVKYHKSDTNYSTLNPVSDNEEQITAMRFLQGMYLILSNLNNQEIEKEIKNEIQTAWGKYLKAIRKIKANKIEQTENLAYEFAKILVKYHCANETKNALLQVMMAHDLATMMKKHPIIKTISEEGVDKEKTITEETATIMKLPNNTYEMSLITTMSFTGKEWKKRQYPEIFNQLWWAHIEKKAGMQSGNNWLRNFLSNPNNISVLSDCGVPAPPSARWLPLPANVQRIDIKTTKQDETYESTFYRFATPVAFGVEESQQRDIAKKNLLIVIKENLERALDKYLSTYQKTNEPVDFFINYQSLLSPFYLEKNLPHEDNNGRFVAMAKECFEELEKEYKKEIVHKDVKFNLIFCQTNGAINKLASHSVYKRGINTTSDDDKLRRLKINSLLGKITAFSKDGITKNENGFYQFANNAKIEELLSNPAFNPEKKSPEINELKFRAKAAYHLQQLLDNQPPFDKLTEYKRNTMMAALEFHTVGSQGLTLAGCKSARDRTAIFSAAVKTMQENPETMNNWDILHEGILKSLKQGHHTRAMDWHIALVKLGDVHKEYGKDLPAYHERELDLKVLTKPFSAEKPSIHTTSFLLNKTDVDLIEQSLKEKSLVKIIEDKNTDLQQRGWILSHSQSLVLSQLKVLDQDLANIKKEKLNEVQSKKILNKYVSDDTSDKFYKDLLNARNSKTNIISCQKQQITNLFYYQLIQNILTMITQAQWKVKRGGSTIQNKKYPENIAKIFNKCHSLTKDDYKANIIYEKEYNNLIKMGVEASKPHKIDFFGQRKRDKATQDFYDLFKQVLIKEIENNIQEGKQEEEMPLLTSNNANKWKTGIIKK